MKYSSILLSIIMVVLASCSSRTKVSALVQDDQTIVFNKGYEGILSEDVVQIICSPSNNLLIDENGLEFEIQITNKSNQSFPISLENVRAYDVSNKRLEIVSPEKLIKSAKSRQIWSSIGNGLGTLSDAVSSNYAYNTIQRSNNQMLRSQQTETYKNRFDQVVAAIQSCYLQKQTIFPNNTHIGCFLVRGSHPRNNVIKLQLFVPELNETRQFNFAVSRE